MIPQLFVDLDGVLADFDGYYEKCFGVKPDQDNYQPKSLWKDVREHGSFYRDMTPMSYAVDLWINLHRFHPRPILLSGIPHSIPDASKQKRGWVDQHLGRHVPLVCCPSVEKCEHANPGDVLLDDRLKYSKYWINMGGIFIQHLNVPHSLIALQAVYRFVFPILF